MNTPKDPAHVASARARWGPARVVRLDDLNPDERNAVLVLVRLFGARKDATEGQSPVASEGGRRVSVNPS